MKVTTQRDMIRAVANRWRTAYQHRDSNETLTIGGQRPSIQEIQERLDALDPETATAADVDKAIGTGGWVRLKCDECQNDVLAIVTVGEEPDYESCTASLCKHCVTEAVHLMQ